MSSVMERINAVCERNRKDYEALAQMTGQTIAEIEADLTAPDPTPLENLTKLSNDMSVEFDGGNITLYDSRAYSARYTTTITSEEMEALLALYTDGCCPVCMTEIPLNDIICDNCLAQAQQVR